MFLLNRKNNPPKDIFSLTFGTHRKLILKFKMCLYQGKHTQDFSFRFYLLVNKDKILKTKR